MITREANARRKSLRVTVPLAVEIEGTTYAARDWSVLGVGIDGLGQPPAEGLIIPARISLPLPESTLVLPVQLAFRGMHDDVAGFDFHELTDRTRRVLRHYIEMSLDGSLGEAQQLVTAAALPMAQQGGAVTLDAQPVQASHHPARTWGFAFAGLLVAAGLGSILFYNAEYKVEGTGFVAGSIARVTANHDGRIGTLLVRAGATVDPQTPLFAVENPGLRHEVEVLEQQITQLAQVQSQMGGARQRAESGLIGEMKRNLSMREQELANARQLLTQGAITQREVMTVAMQAADMRQDYLRAVADTAHRQQTYDASDGLQRLRMELATKKALLATQEAERTVRAPVRGKVFHVDKAAGEYVSAQDPVLLLETDTTPSVFLRLADDDALKLKPGMPAVIYVPFEDRKYKATVAAVGLTAANAAVASTQEGGLRETLVRLEFEDKRVRLPPNARVNVWIRSLSSLLS